MKAIVWTKYGTPEGLKLQEVEKPVPKEDEVLVKIRAKTVTAGDCEIRRLELPLMLSFPVRLYAGFLRPKRITILGQELAGDIETVGSLVTNYSKGDPVFGTTGFGFGAYAEYICLPANPGDADGVLAPKPTNLSYEESAAVPTAGFEALHIIKEANVQPGTKALVIGAGGSIGTFSIQLAKHYGAEVTGVDSPDKLDMVRSLGADHVIDYTTEDYTSSKKTYDLIIDVVGKHSVSRRLELLNRQGVYFLAYARPFHIVLGLWTALTSKKRIKMSSAIQKKEGLIYLKELLEAGKIRPVIDRLFPMEQTADAHSYAESGVKKGNICITLV